VENFVTCDEKPQEHWQQEELVEENNLEKKTMTSKISIP
jgi:hypothetical protein